MSENNIKASKKYFAAANTYHGFKSYFDRIFSPTEYEYIYVLKGGPGTGKSSIMRRISEFFIEKSLEIEEIYCSSDPHSLDGVTISGKYGKIAILDGTAPHEADAKEPCIKDEIINLADGLDKRWLKSKKDEAITLLAKKSEAYKTAYDYLSLAGKSAEIITKAHNNVFDISKAKNKAECILADISEPNAAIASTRLISSFGRYGRYVLSTSSSQCERVIKVRGREESCGLFMNIISEILGLKGYEYIHFPAALDPSLTDAVYLRNSKIMIVRDEAGEINADEFTRLTPIYEERIKTASVIKSEALNEAKRWFAIASDLHFRLEKIYGDAMNFEKNDQICEDLITEIANILEITI